MRVKLVIVLVLVIHKYHQKAVEGRVLKFRKITKYIIEENLSNLFSKFERAANLIQYH